MSVPDVVTESELAAAPETVWVRVASAAGVNYELAPWMRMTSPRGAERQIENAPLGRPWFRSWVLLFGLIPFDFDHLQLERIEPGRAFLERSRMASALVWEHERTLTPSAGGTRVTDRVAFVPRMGWMARIQRRVIVAIFRHRHRRLRKWFGERR